jgi:hypothetical protein
MSRHKTRPKQDTTKLDGHQLRWLGDLANRMHRRGKEYQEIYSKCLEVFDRRFGFSFTEKQFCEALEAHTPCG